MLGEHFIGSEVIVTCSKRMELVYERCWVLLPCLQLHAKGKVRDIDIGNRPEKVGQVRPQVAQHKLKFEVGQTARYYVLARLGLRSSVVE